MAYTETYEGTTDGTVGDHVVDTSALQPEGVPDIAVPFMREVGDGGASDRIAVLRDPANDQVLIAPPAKVGGLDFLLYGQYPHSIQRSELELFLADSEVIGAAGTLDVPHGLGVVPDFVSVVLQLNPGIAAAYDWAVTAIDDTNISLKNWQAAGTVTVTIIAIKAHSIFSELVVGPFDMTLAGVAQVDQVHGLVWPGSDTAIIPGLVSAFPYSAGGVVQPVGGPIVTSLPDDTEWHFDGNDALADLILRTYGMYPHSIQQ